MMRDASQFEERARRIVQHRARRWRHLHQDMVQQCLLDLHQAWSNGSDCPEGPILDGSVVSQIRHLQTQKRGGGAADTSIDAASVQHWLPDRHPNDRRPPVTNDELCAAMRRMPDQREATVLCLLARGLSWPDIARCVSLQHRHVQRVAHAAIESLRRLLLTTTEPMPCASS